MTGSHQKKARYAFLLPPILFFLAACATKTGGPGLRGGSRVEPFRNPGLAVE